MQTSLRPLVFWPTFLILLAAVIASYVDLDAFLATASALNDAVLTNFSWLFSLSSLYLLVMAVVVYFSPLGRIRIGGRDATPLLSRLRWFSITLCTTLAVGVLFWTTAEPLWDRLRPVVWRPVRATPCCSRCRPCTCTGRSRLTPFTPSLR